MFGNEISPLISVMGTKVPGNEGSWERKFQGTKVLRNDSSTMELSFLGTKVLWYESSSYPVKADAVSVNDTIMNEFYE